MNFLDLRLPSRFWDKVHAEPNSGCWLWTGAINRTGYAVFRVRGGAHLGHRVALGAVQWLCPSLVIDHRCRTPSCVNPAHLEQVTQHENTLRNVRSVRSHCPAGHPFDDANTYRNGTIRKCRRCHADKQAKRKASLNARQAVSK